MSEFVAWVDILGFASLMDDDVGPDPARRAWDNLQVLAERTLCSGDKNTQIFGINDGFFVRTRDLHGLVKGLVDLYQLWFDQYANTPKSRPLLRGAIAEATDTTAAQSACVRIWLKGRSFRTAHEDERVLNGGRLFLCEPKTAQDVRSARVGVYDWKGLSGWDLPRTRRDRRISEVLWLAVSDPEKLVCRFETVVRLYEREAKKCHSQEDKGVKLAVLLQYEETLKLALRCLGDVLRNDPDQVDALGPLMERFLDYRPDQFQFTWGLWFVAVETAWLGEHPKAKDLAKRVADRLKKERSNSDRARYAADFERELDHPTYEVFSQWYRQATKMAV